MLMSGFWRKWLVTGLLGMLAAFFAGAGFSVAEAQKSPDSESALEIRKGLVILLEFPDVALPINQQMVRERFNKLDFYVREMSYGKIGASVDLAGWYRLPQSIKSYAISPANLEVDKSRVVKLIQDAIDAADSSNDFSALATGFGKADDTFGVYLFGPAQRARLTTDIGQHQPVIFGETQLEGEQ